MSIMIFGPIFIWCLIGFCSHKMFMTFSATFRNYEKDEKRGEFISYFTGFVHACIATLFSILSTFYLCSNENENALTSYECFS